MQECLKEIERQKERKAHLDRKDQLEENVNKIAEQESKSMLNRECFTRGPRGEVNKNTTKRKKKATGRYSEMEMKQKRLSPYFRHNSECLNLCYRKNEEFFGGGEKRFKQAIGS